MYVSLLYSLGSSGWLESNESISQNCDLIYVWSQDLLDIIVVKTESHWVN